MPFNHVWMLSPTMRIAGFVFTQSVPAVAKLNEDVCAIDVLAGSAILTSSWTRRALFH